MKKIVLLTILGNVLAAQTAEIGGSRIRAHVKFLSSDLLEGRGVGARGGDLATEYLAAQFALVGARPSGDHETYFQRVPLVGVETEPSAHLSAGASEFKWLDEFVGQTQRQQKLVDFEGDAIFVGHGIAAPEFNWDDFKDVDVRGKVLVLFTNEPQSPDPKLFGGRALTYYGRWTYKYEQALRKGALAAVIVHTTPTAGYGWDVVRNSWGREDSQVELARDAPALAFTGWLTQEAGDKLLRQSGKSVAELLAAADKRDFRPIPLGLRIKGHLPAKVRQIESRNVAAIVEGGDPSLKSQAVVFTAHWDHLGIGPPVNGDSIYNGAVDNATGCGMLLEIARAWASMSPKPKRSALFLAVTAEEGGLRGSEYYARRPIIPPGRIAANLNFDAFYPFGRTTDVVVTGAERTTLWPVVQQVAQRFKLTIAPDPRPEQGSYYRSDHFSLAKAGIPAFSVHMGAEFASKPPGYGEKIFAEYNSNNYHRPSDQYREDWDFSGIEEMARFGYAIGVEAANLPKLPTWRQGDEFLAARQNSGVR